MRERNTVQPKVGKKPNLIILEPLAAAFQPKVTIVMSTYNRAGLLPRALDSVINQTLTDWELIVIDDCSPDNTRSVVAEYIEKDSRILYIRNLKNLGSGDSKSPIMLNAEGKYIAVLDDDDWWKPSYLEKLVKALENNPAAPISYSDIIRADTKTGKEYYWDCSLGKPFPNILPSATLLRTETYKKVGGWDITTFCKGYHAEADYYIRVGGQKTFIHVPEPLVHADISPDAMSRNRRKNAEALLVLVKKHGHTFDRKTLALYYTRIGLHYQEGNLGNRKYFTKAIKEYPFIPEAWGGLILSLISHKLFLTGYRTYRRATGYPPAGRYE
jgi:glycosyltransferase involved in cell wall biosynthesis